MTRFIGHRVLAGVIEVYGYAQTIPEALAMEAALRTVPKAEAFIPEPEPAPELPPQVEAIAYRDADESGPAMMDRDEAMTR